jgi:hypothetical protein
MKYVGSNEAREEIKNVQNILIKKSQIAISMEIEE